MTLFMQSDNMACATQCSALNVARQFCGSLSKVPALLVTTAVMKSCSAVCLAHLCVFQQDSPGGWADEQGQQGVRYLKHELFVFPILPHQLTQHVHLQGVPIFEFEEYILILINI